MFSIDEVKRAEREINISLNIMYAYLKVCFFFVASVHLMVISILSLIKDDLDHVEFTFAFSLFVLFIGNRLGVKHFNEYFVNKMTMQTVYMSIVLAFVFTLVNILTQSP